MKVFCGWSQIRVHVPKAFDGWGGGEAGGGGGVYSGILSAVSLGWGTMCADDGKSLRFTQPHTEGLETANLVLGFIAIICLRTPKQQRE